MKKFIVLVALIMSFSLLFSGCAVLTNILDPLPEEYVEGLRLSRDFPDDELELYDDAIVFDQEDDDEEISITYGVEDEIDDVIDFYEELFEDNELTIEDADEGKDDYYAKGSGDGFKFEVTVEEASGKYEERAFATVVEVNIEFYSMGEETLQNLQGMWLVTGVDGQISDEARRMGIAIEFDGMKLSTYDGFEPEYTDIDFIFLDDNTIQYYMDGEENEDVVGFVGNSEMTLEEDGTVLNLEKVTYDEYMSYQVSIPADGIIDITAPLTDTEIEYYISDVYWYFAAYIYPDGSYDSPRVSEIFYFSSDYTGTYEYEGEYENISWYVNDGDIYITFSSGAQYYWTADYAYDGTQGFFYMNDMTEGYEDNLYAYSWYKPEIAVSSDDDDDVFKIPLEEDLSDEDLEFWISDIDWYVIAYIYPDGSYENTSGWRLNMNSDDNSGEEEIEGTTERFTWYVLDGLLYFTYDSDGTEYYMPVDYEYDGEEDYLYLYDMSEGYEGGYYLFDINVN